jgi:hypothetical protein
VNFEEFCPSVAHLITAEQVRDPQTGAKLQAVLGVLMSLAMLGSTCTDPTLAVRILLGAVPLVRFLASEAGLPDDLMREIIDAWATDIAQRKDPNARS